MENNKKTIHQFIFNIPNIILLCATVFQIVVFMIKGGLGLAGISIGLIVVLLVNMFYKDKKTVKIITLILMGIYLVENAIMTYVYSPNPMLPIILFVVEIIMDIAILQKIIIDIVIKNKAETTSTHA